MQHILYYFVSFINYSNMIPRFVHI